MQGFLEQHSQNIAKPSLNIIVLRVTESIVSEVLNAKQILNPEVHRATESQSKDFGATGSQSKDFRAKESQSKDFRAKESQSKDFRATES